MNPILQDLIDSIAAEHTVAVSVTTFLNGVPKLISDAVDKALANGATAEQLAPLTALSDAIKADTKALADAVTANTPSA